MTASTFFENYHIGLSLMTWVGIIGMTLLGRKFGPMVPAIGRANAINQEAFNKKMQREVYAANQKLNRKWGLLDQVLIFVLIIPFCVTLDSQPLWNMVLDIFIILMFYDFFYYLTHRFIFHNGGFLGGPLMWVHAVHHQQKNPCRQDSSYIHPLEVAIGLGLFAGSILVLSLILGEFHVVTIILSWTLFSEINLHNHDLWEEQRFPWKYLSYMSKMHHNHHARFTGGNFATISLLYDWLFGTYDRGDGYKKLKQDQAPEKAT